MKMLKKSAIIIVLCFLLVWGTSLGKCELLTFIHGDEFSELYKANTMIGEQKYLKVLEYSDRYARVYCVEKDNYMANILSFVRSGEQWEYDKWERCVLVKNRERLRSDMALLVALHIWRFLRRQGEKTRGRFFCLVHRSPAS